MSNSDETAATKGEIIPPGAVAGRNGGWLKPWQPGQRGNPSGVGGKYLEVRKLAAAASPQAMRELILIAEDQKEDSRVRVVAIQTILDRGVGKPRDHSAEDAKERPDLSRLSREDRELLASIMLRALGKAP